MLSIDVSHAVSFLSLPYEAALRPRLERAAGWLQNGGGKGSDFIGWVTLPRDYDRGEYARILAAAKKIQGDSKALVVIGIGGSYLGARGVIECLCSPNYNLKKKSTPNIYFIGNGLSSDALREVTELIGDDDFSVNVISKSGTTTEPAVAFRFFREKLEKKYGKAEAVKRIYATTDAHKGALKSLADQEGYEEFVVPDNIGGRYSVLTAVGLLPIAVAGIDIDALMTGAKTAEDTLCGQTVDTNDVLKYAAARNCFYNKGKSLECFVSYEPAMTLFNEWLKQLFAESEGKDGKGLFPVSCVFSTDLHSVGQYIQESGSKLMFETVMQFARPQSDYMIGAEEGNIDGLNFLAGKEMSYVNEKARQGTLLAHTAGGVGNFVLEIDALDAENMGYMIYFFEKVCAVSGYMLGVNPFNQPGVESYKKNMFALLGKPGYESEKENLEKQLGLC